MNNVQGLLKMEAGGAIRVLECKHRLLRRVLRHGFHAGLFASGQNMTRAIDNE